MQEDSPKVEPIQEAPVEENSDNKTQQNDDA